MSTASSGITGTAAASRSWASVHDPEEYVEIEADDLGMFLPGARLTVWVIG
ncbi:hypothetical protein L3Q67_26980 [Saccharothrix sp. AJ9571]|nr:hypothetical protein L3Q67_26980 [Saccharothrix sp. AJ9571]